MAGVDNAEVSGAALAYGVLPDGSVTVCVQNCRAASDAINDFDAEVPYHNDQAKPWPSVRPKGFEGQSGAAVKQGAKDKGLLPASKNPNKLKGPNPGKERVGVDPGHVDKKKGSLMIIQMLQGLAPVVMSRTDERPRETRIQAISIFH